MPPESMDINIHMLRAITNNFSKERKVGSGRYGDVYKGLYNGEEFAVMKLHPLQGLDDNAFYHECRNLIGVHHPNVVRLIGYCYELRKKYVENNVKPDFANEMERALCLEYVQGGSLDKHISDESCDLDWPTCYRIIKGTCEGLNHLHAAIGIPIFHLELKSANILIDKNLTAKISLSLSRLIASSKTQKTEIQGTKYMPAEYIIDGTISGKVEVFNLGVIILNIMSGYNGFYRSFDLPAKQFIELVTNSWKERLQVQGTFGHAKQEVNILRVKACVGIALRCLHNDSKTRPYIKDIVNELEELESNIKKMSVSIDQSNDRIGLLQTMELNILERTVTGSEEPSHLDLARLRKVIKRFSERKRNPVSGYQEVHKIMELNILERIVAGHEEPGDLDFPLLQRITENFSEKKRIGVGGCGEVYKGIVQNGIVAVKRLFKSRTIKDKMFHREVKSLITVRHNNIVRFFGYCSFTAERVSSFEGVTIMVDIRERLLCFEYISNGSLESHITDELRGLEWHTRYEIIVGICKGLLYLHNEKEIIHMDLKPANILLDDHMVPKITDFGLSRLDNNSQTRTTSRLISPGYCAPEYILEGKSSSKSDIYSLGVIILEVVTGSKKLTPNITKVIRRWRHRWVKSSNHPALGYQQVKKCLDLAHRCTQHDPTCRPDMTDIIHELNKIDSKEDQFQVIPSLEGMLGIEPLEIQFPFELYWQVSHTVVLSNDTDDHFAFITKPSLRRLHTEPAKGIVPPGSMYSTVTVSMMQAQFMALSNHRYKEEITVLSTRVDGGLAVVDITKDMFIEKEGRVVDEVNVMVTIDRPPLEEES